MLLLNIKLLLKKPMLINNFTSVVRCQIHSKTDEISKAFLFEFCVGYYYHNFAALNIFQLVVANNFTLSECVLAESRQAKILDKPM